MANTNGYFGANAEWVRAFSAELQSKKVVVGPTFIPINKCRLVDVVNDKITVEVILEINGNSPDTQLVLVDAIFHTDIRKG